MDEPAGESEPDGLKAYLPPEGPQSVHGVAHEYFERVGVHRIGNMAIYGPEDVILTADEDAQRELERRGLDELPAEAAREALSAYRDRDTDRVAEIAEEHRDRDDESLVKHRADDGDSVLDKSGNADDSESDADDDREDALRGSVEDLRERLSTGEFDHRLDELEAAESAGENRTTAIEAIQRRRGKLADPPEDATVEAGNDA